MSSVNVGTRGFLSSNPTGLVDSQGNIIDYKTLANTLLGQGVIPTNTASGGGGGGTPSGLFNQVLSATPTTAGTGLTTWVNQGGATVADAATGVALKATGHAGLVIRMRTMAAPATPYTITALIGYTTVGAANAWSGIGWYDGTNKLELLGPNFSSYWLYLGGKLNTPSSYSGNDAATGAINAAAGAFHWLQLSDDGTNITMRYGIDGATFLQLFTVAKSSGFLGSSGYSNIGFFLSDGGSDAVSTLLSWKKS